MSVGAFAGYGFQSNAFQVSTVGQIGSATVAAVTEATTASVVAPLTSAATSAALANGGDVATVFDVGDVARVSVAFTQAGVALNPTAVTLTVLTPTLVSTTYTYGGVDGALVRSATGNYYLDIALALVGHYRWRWAATGTGASAVEDWLVVRTRAVS